MTKKMAIKTDSRKTKKHLQIGMPGFTGPAFKLVLVLSLLFGGGVVVVKTPGVLSNIWPIEKIAIVGEVEHLQQSQLARILLAKEFSGMLSVDLQQLRSQVIQLPWIKDVQIRKVWPDTLSFSVEEYQPIAQINQSYLTDEGVLIERGDYITSQPVLILEIDKVQMEKEPDLLYMLEKLQQIRVELAKHHLDIERLKVNESNSWLIQIENKFLIKVGRKQQLARIEKLIQVYAAIENKNELESIDLRYSNGLAVKFANKLSEPKNG